MFTVITSEIRWFLEGTLPGEVATWFGKLGKKLINETERTDTYLVLPDTNKVGIKVREGRVEIKKMIDLPDEIRINENIAGQSEIWQKWSFATRQSGNLPLSFILEPSQWINIRKSRSLYRFAIEAGELKPHKASTPIPENGAHIELAEISIKGNPWWSLGVEAFGNHKQLKENLGLISNQVINNFDHDHFAMQTSKSYPEWLTRFTT